MVSRTSIIVRRRVSLVPFIGALLPELNATIFLDKTLLDAYCPAFSTVLDTV